jgi:hypothetical protein
MDRNQIIALYQKFEYELAAKFYIKFGTNETLKSLLGNETPYTERKLREWIQEIGENINAPKDDFLAPEIKEFDSDVKIYPENHPLYNLIKKRNEAYREKNYLFSKLYYFNSNEERKLAAFRILELRNQINEIYEIIEVFENTGKLPKDKKQFKEKAIPENIGLAYKKMEALKRNIRRYRQQKKDTEILEKELKNILEYLNI